MWVVDSCALVIVGGKVSVVAVVVDSGSVGTISVVCCVVDDSVKVKERLNTMSHLESRWWCKIDHLSF